MTIKEYQNRQDYIKHANAIEKKYGIPNNMLVGLLQTESGFQEDVVRGKRKSSAGAIGIAQFMPNTAKQFGIDPTEPYQSIEAAGKYLSQNYKILNDWDDTLRSYNMGLGGVKQWKAGKKALPKETADYVGKVYKNAGKDYTNKQISSKYVETQPQEQENIINYVSPTQDTTIVTNLPKSEESINFAEEIRKLEQQKQEEFQKIEQEINQRTQVQPQEQQIEEEEYTQPTPQINYQDIFNQVSQFVDTPIAQQGGIKTDPMGYWNPENLNRPVIIPSPSISMKNIDFSVLGVADTGETKLMHPNEEHYFSGAKKVTEYPIEYIKKLRNGR